VQFHNYLLMFGLNVLLASCFADPLPTNEDVKPFIADILNKREAGSGDKIKIISNECRLMQHGKSHECDVAYNLVPDTARKSIYLIIMKDKKTNKWVFIDTQ